MQYTSEQVAEFKRSVEKRRQLQTIVIGGLVIAFGLGVLLQDKLPFSERWLVLLWLLIAVGGTIFVFVVWRCPACGRYLGRGRFNYCRRCGVELRSPAA
jgi:protein-S-isoprenylcysteine O-methyltransferase Ste14